MKTYLKKQGISAQVSKIFRFFLLFGRLLLHTIVDCIVPAKTRGINCFSTSANNRRLYIPSSSSLRSCGGPLRGCYLEIVQRRKHQFPSRAIRSRWQHVATRTVKYPCRKNTFFSIKIEFREQLTTNLLQIILNFLAKLYTPGRLSPLTTIADCIVRSLRTRLQLFAPDLHIQF